MGSDYKCMAIIKGLSTIDQDNLKIGLNDIFSFGVELKAWKETDIKDMIIMFPEGAEQPESSTEFQEYYVTTSFIDNVFNISTYSYSDIFFPLWEKIKTKYSADVTVIRVATYYQETDYFTIEDLDEMPGESFSGLIGMVLYALIDQNEIMSINRLVKHIFEETDKGLIAYNGYFELEDESLPTNFWEDVVVAEEYLRQKLSTYLDDLTFWALKILISDFNRKNMYPLHNAIENRDEEEVDRIIKEGNLELDLEDEDELTPLMVAVKKSPLLTDKLIKFGAKINEKGAMGYTPLNWVSDETVFTYFNTTTPETNRMDIIQILLSYGANPNIPADNCIPILYCLGGVYKGMTPIMNLLRTSGDKETVQLLINAGADLSLVDEQGWDALHYALRYSEDISIARMLWRSPDTESITKLMVLAIKNSEKMFFEFLPEVKKYVDVTELLSLTIKENADVEAINNLIELGADASALSKDGTPIICEAVSHNENFDVLITLLNASRKKDSEDKGGYGIFMRAATYRDVNYISKMLKHKIGNPSQINQRVGYNVYHSIAEANNSLGLVSLIEKIGLDINALSVNGCTPIENASQFNTIDIIKEFLDLGANVNIYDNEGDGPLHAASYAHGNDIERLKVLLEAGADINRKNNEGKTPLILVAEKYSSCEGYEFLLKMGADNKLIDNSGRNAEDYLN